MDWPHAPLHRFGEAGNYFVTAGTLHKQHLFATPSSLTLLQDLLFALARRFDCWLQAWALFSNHYHLVVACDRGEDVRRMVARLHTKSAIELNALDRRLGRNVWYQFWDVHLTHQTSWLARLRYTHENAVHHGLVSDATKYEWCSASWFAANAPRSFVETVRGVQIDRVNVYDEF